MSQLNYCCELCLSMNVTGKDHNAHVKCLACGHIGHVGDTLILKSVEAKKRRKDKKKRKVSNVE